jgi:hypothetical protein
LSKKTERRPKKGNEHTTTTFEEDSHERTEEGEDEEEGGEQLGVLRYEKRGVNSKAMRKKRNRRTVMQLVL